MKRTPTLWKQQRKTALWMSIPAAAGLLIFVVLPLVLGAFWSFTNKRLISPQPTEYVGLSNYDRLLSVRYLTLDPIVDPATGDLVLEPDGSVSFPRVRSVLIDDPQFEGYQEWFTFDTMGKRIAVVAKDPTFMRAVVNTIVFVLVIVPFQGGLALLMALLVSQRLRGINIFRTIYFSPVVTSMAVIAIVWKFLYNPEEGLINRFLTNVSFGFIEPPGWLVDADTALLAIIILSAWQAAGFQMVIFLAGIQSIPEILYEAAEIDGANTWQKFRFVTWPQLRNTTIFVVIATTILAFRLFTQIDVLTRGGPQDSTVTIIFHAVNQGFRQQKVGYGATITVVFFLLVLSVALIQRLVMRSEREVD